MLRLHGHIFAPKGGVSRCSKCVSSLGQHNWILRRAPKSSMGPSNTLGPDVRFQHAACRSMQAGVFTLCLPYSVRSDTGGDHHACSQPYGGGLELKSGGHQSSIDRNSGRVISAAIDSIEWVIEYRPDTGMGIPWSVFNDPVPHLWRRLSSR